MEYICLLTCWLLLWWEIQHILLITICWTNSFHVIGKAVFVGRISFTSWKGYSRPSPGKDIMAFTYRWYGVWWQFAPRLRGNPACRSMDSKAFSNTFGEMEMPSQGKSPTDYYFLPSEWSFRVFLKSGGIFVHVPLQLSRMWKFYWKGPDAGII